MKYVTKVKSLTVANNVLLALGHQVSSKGMKRNTVMKKLFVVIFVTSVTKPKAI